MRIELGPFGLAVWRGYAGGIVVWLDTEGGSEASLTLLGRSATWWHCIPVRGQHWRERTLRIGRCAR